MNATDNETLSEILVAYGLQLQTAERATSGLINQTWIVATEQMDRYVVQRLHPGIPGDVNERIQFVTRCLKTNNICTPQLVMTSGGETHITIAGATWRVLTYVPGISYDTVPSLQHARETGRLLARFHGTFIDRDDIGVLPPSTTHDLPRHLRRLRSALAAQVRHDEYAMVAALAEEVFAVAEALPGVTLSTPRVVHGDPKISNVLFDQEGRAVCLVDLDTVGRMALVWELGDAFRSWCNPAGEDTERTIFSLDLFAAAVAGYAEVAGRFIDDEEVAGIIPAIETIYTELAARFCADALLEAYFAWDPARFSTRTEHNLVRARGQLNAAKDLVSKREEASRIVDQLFAPRT